MVGKNKMKNWKAAVRNWENMSKEKGQIESKVMQRLSSHNAAKQILKNIQNGNKKSISRRWRYINKKFPSKKTF